MCVFIFQRSFIAHAKNPIGGYFGALTEIAQSFHDNDKAEKFIATAFNAELSLSLYDHDHKVEKLRSSIYLALLENIPLLMFIPRCFRYYYDENGEQQIIDTTDTFEYDDMAGNHQVKSKEVLVHYIEHDLEQIRPLSGIPLKVVVPLMDNELLGIQKMNTSENFRKSAQYLKELQSLYNTIASRMYGTQIQVQVVSALELFGNPQISEEVQLMKRFATQGEQQFVKFGNILFSQQTLNRAIADDFESNRADTTRSEYYRSSDFATACKINDIGGARFQASSMERLAYESKHAGVGVIVPTGAELETFIYNMSENLLCFIRDKVA